jgi:hypothetical protein
LVSFRLGTPLPEHAPVSLDTAPLDRTIHYSVDTRRQSVPTRPPAVRPSTPPTPHRLVPDPLLSTVQLLPLSTHSHNIHHNRGASSPSTTGDRLTQSFTARPLLTSPSVGTTALTSHLQSVQPSVYSRDCHRGGQRKKERGSSLPPSALDIDGPAHLLSTRLLIYFSEEGCTGVPILTT